VEPNGFGLALGFGRRQGPYVFGKLEDGARVPAQGSIMSHLPTLLGHVTQLRSEYDVVAQVRSEYDAVEGEVVT
jgi:hypothetical protein